MSKHIIYYHSLSELSNYWVTNEAYLVNLPNDNYPNPEFVSIDSNELDLNAYIVNLPDENYPNPKFVSIDSNELDLNAYLVNLPNDNYPNPLYVVEDIIEE